MPRGVYKHKRGYRLSEEHRRKISEASHNKGSKNNNWKGGRKICGARGFKYVYIYSPNHPFAVHNYVPEHRLIMEKYLKRFLKPIEAVHHIDGDTLNNKFENLMLFPNHTTHLNFHRLQLKPFRRGRSLSKRVKLILKVSYY